MVSPDQLTLVGWTVPARSLGNLVLFHEESSYDVAAFARSLDRRAGVHPGNLWLLLVGEMGYSSDQVRIRDAQSRISRRSSDQHATVQSDPRHPGGIGDL